MKLNTKIQDFGNNHKEQTIRNYLVICLALAAKRGWFSLDEFSNFLTPDVIRPTYLLQIMDSLIKQGWVVPNKAKGIGYYRLTDKCIKGGSKDQISTELHLKMAKYFTNSGEKMSPIKIAYHWEMAGDTKKAIPYWIDAIKEAFGHGKNKLGMETISHVFKFIPETIRTREIDQVLLESFVDLFESIPLFRSSPEMDSIVDSVIHICSESEASSLTLKAMVYGLSSLIWRGRFKKVRPLFITFFKKSRSLKDSEITYTRKRILGIAYYMRGEISKAVRVFDSISGDTEHLPDNPILLEYYLAVAHCYALAGRVSRAIGLLDSIRTHANLKGLTSVEGWALSTLSVILIECGRYEKARHILQELEHIKDWDAHYLCRFEYLWVNAYMEYSKGHFSGMAEFLDKLFFDSHKGYNVAGYFTPTAIEISVALKNMDRNILTKTGLERFAEMFIKRLHADSIYPAIRATAKVYHALYTFIYTGNADLALEEIDEAEDELRGVGCYLAIGKARILKASILCERGRLNDAVEALKGYSHVIQDFGEDLLGGYLRDMIVPEPPEKLLLSAVMKISHSLGTLKDRDMLIQKAVETLNRLSRAERGAVFLFEDHNNHKELVLKASQGITKEYVDSDAFKDMLAWIKDVIKTKKGKIWKPTERHLRLFQPKAAICAPLIMRDQLVGVVYQDNRIIGDIFDQRDIDLIQALATQITASLENASAYKEIDRLNKLLSEKNAYYEEEKFQEYHFGEIIAKSMVMKKVLDLVEKVACIDTTVFLTGETGVGKDLIAMTIHKHSHRKDRPFIKVNCATLPEGLIESELFGHEKGAFTGAGSIKMGRFELADGGTIFLDEIGELPLNLQAKLLRVLQEGEFERLGGTSSKHVDVRIIAATNRNLEKELKSSQFRADLFYRLNAFPINIPPLRERKDDIPALAYYFLTQASKKLGKRFNSITNRDITRLIDYSWPGNIRELKHVIERSAILSQEDSFTIFLPFKKESFLGNDMEQIIPLKEMEKLYIVKVLEHTRWKVSGTGGAAGLLGMKRSTLLSRMKKLGIEKPWKRG